MRYFSIWFVVCLSLGAWSAPASAAHPAQELAQETAEEIMAKLKQEQEKVQNDVGRLYELVNDIVLPHFDFRKMSSWVLGVHWRRASEQQKEEFTEQFKKLLVRTYGNALLDNLDKEIKYIGTAESGDDEVTVRTEIPQPGAFPLPINYKMYLKDGEWKVFDVSIEGVSLVTNYRSTFNRDIKQGGLDKLIAKLETRNEEAMQ